MASPKNITRFEISATSSKQKILENLPNDEVVIPKINQRFFSLIRVISVPSKTSHNSKNRRKPTPMK